MRQGLFLVAAACAFGLAPFASKLGVAGGAALLVLLAVALSVAASGGLNALSVASGALGAFAAGTLSGTSSATAGACLVGFAFVERTLRVRGRALRLVHIGVALVGGALAGALAGAYVSSPPAVRCVAIVVSAVLVSLPLLVAADDAVAHALDEAASRLNYAALARVAPGVRGGALPPFESIGAVLRHGAYLRRNADDAMLDRETSRGVGRTWRSLLRVAEARLRLARPDGQGPTPASSPPERESPAEAVRRMLDQRIVEHVAALARAYMAVDTAHAAEAGLDDAALRSVDAAGETLEDVSRAIVDVKA